MTPADLKEAKFRGPVRFIDGRKGMAQQDFQCVAEPRFGYSWRRENRQDRGRQFYTVDGREVADLEEAARLLAATPDPQSPDALMRAHIDEFKASPSLNYGATRALSEARCNASAGPFGMLRAWMRRTEHAYHVGINAYAEKERTAGVKWDNYRWLYEAKSAAHETYRLMYLFEADRKADTGLICALGARCRDCPILTTIEAELVAQRDHPKFPRDIEDADIDAAKIWTCIAHILHEREHPVDGVFVASARDREEASDDAERWAAIAEGDPEESANAVASTPSGYRQAPESSRT